MECDTGFYVIQLEMNNLVTQSSITFNCSFSLTSQSAMSFRWTKSMGNCGRHISKISKRSGRSGPTITSETLWIWICLTTNAMTCGPNSRYRLDSLTVFRCWTTIAILEIISSLIVLRTTGIGAHRILIALWSRDGIRTITNATQFKLIQLISRLNTWFLRAGHNRPVVLSWHYIIWCNLCSIKHLSNAIRLNVKSYAGGIVWFKIMQHNDLNECQLNMLVNCTLKKWLVLSLWRRADNNRYLSIFALHNESLL
jgi:hypothetical protein